MSEVHSLAQRIEIDSLQKTVTRLSTELAQVSIDLRDKTATMTAVQEQLLASTQELSATNVSLIVEKKSLEDAQEKQQIHLQEMEDDLTGVRHQLERERVISAHIFNQTKSGSSIIQLPNHFSLGKKVKKSDLVIRDFDVRQLSDVVKHIDEMYRQVDNKELREILK